MEAQVLGAIRSDDIQTEELESKKLGPWDIVDKGISAKAFAEKL